MAFKLRDGCLHLTVFNRSNDLLFGHSTTNMIQFSMIQEVLSSWLGVEMGTLAFWSDSLHLYESDPFGSDKPLFRPAENTPFDLYGHVKPRLLSYMNPREFQGQLHAVYRADHRATQEIKEPVMRAWAAILYSWARYQERRIHDAVAVLRYAGGAPDWKIECLRFLVSAAVRNKFHKDISGDVFREVQSVAHEQWGHASEDQQIYHCRALWDYVCQDDPKMKMALWDATQNTVTPTSETA
jgi:hypothetical protein